MSDYLVRVMGKEANVRGVACVTTELVREAARRHQTSPLATAALGQALTGAALLGSMLKVQHRIAMKIQSEGLAQKIVTEGDSYGNVRGYLSVPGMAWDGPITAPAVAQAIGRQGRITVVKDLKLRSLYESTVPLQTGYLDADLTYYLHQSEQTPSVVEIGVQVEEDGTVTAAGGMLIQTLPGYSETAGLERLSERLDDLPHLEQVLADGKTPHDLLATVFRDTEFQWLEDRAVQFKCECSRARTEAALRSIGKAEIKSLIRDGEAVVDCHYCHERYLFDRADLEALLV